MVCQFSLQEFSSPEYFENIFRIASGKFFQKFGKTNEDYHLHKILTVCSKMSDVNLTFGKGSSHVL